MQGQHAERQQTPLDISALDEQAFLLSPEDLDEGEYGPQSGDEKHTVTFFEHVEVNRHASRNAGGKVLDKYLAINVSWTNSIGKRDTYSARLEQQNALEYWATRFPKQYAEYLATKARGEVEVIPLDVLALTKEQHVLLVDSGFKDVRRVAKLTKDKGEKLGVPGIDKVIARAKGYLETLEKTK